MAILRAIVAGERDGVRLAQLRDPQCKSSVETFAKALAGTWKDEHLFVLKQSLALLSDLQTGALAEVMTEFVRASGSDRQVFYDPFNYEALRAAHGKVFGLPVVPYYRLEGLQANLGIPLPKGVVRVYKKDSAGNAQFVGEDRIDHTPKGEKVRLKLGDAFDVTADKKQTDFKKLAGSGRYNYIYEAAFQIELKNAKNEAVNVKVVEPVPGDREMLEESQTHSKEASNTAVWKVDVPANGKTVLSYRVRVKY